jgi:uncharacterized protein (DUF2141 family)
MNSTATLAAPCPLGASLLALIGAICLTGAPAAAQAPGACHGEPTATRLRVIIDNVHDARGEMTATLYGDDPAKFLKRGGELMVWRDKAQSPGQEMCVWLPGPGTYAMALYQDTNGSRHFDHGVFGPTEPYGFSRNPRLFFGPPSVGQVKFKASDSEITVHVRMRNP